MSNRIDTTFTRLREQNRKAFVAYVAGGDPDFDRSLEILHALADAGADIIELGVLFPTPWLMESSISWRPIDPFNPE